MLQYQHGPLISNIEVITIYLDVTLPQSPQRLNWSGGGEPAMADRIDKFISFITNSLYIDALSEYNETDKNGVPYHIGRGKLIASYSTIQTPLSASDLIPPNLVKSSGIQKVLRQAIQIPNFPLPNPNRGYFVFMPVNLYLDPNDVDKGYGYHDSFTINVQGQKTDVYYAVLQHPIYPTDEETFNKFTVEITHELVEMITDPKLEPTRPKATGWAEGNNEIADVCQLLNKISFGFQGYLVTSFWSNQYQRCIHSLTLQVVINNIHDHVPGTREQVALVSAYPKVKIGENYVVAVPDLTFKKDLLNTTNIIPIRIEIWRHTRIKPIKWHVEEIDGEEYVVSGHEKHLVPENWNTLTQDEKDNLLTTFIQALVPPGFVRGLNLDYNLTTQQFIGDEMGSAGNQIHVPQDPGNQYTPEFWFTITQS